MKTKKYLLALATLIFIIMGCTEKSLLPEPESDLVLKSSDAKLKIAVVSDIHYMDHSLLPENPLENAAFQSLLVSGFNKMVEMSEPIFMQTVSKLKKEKPDVLLVPGDLAFNGELINHEVVKGKFQELAEAGIQVLVTPGNNDINSPDAMSYTGTGSTATDNISPEGFVSAYGDFGYNDALYRDENSLSYFFKIRDDLWILGIDACIYEPESKRNGEIKEGTMNWILDKMTEANENGITVLAMMHFGIAEHYPNESKVMKSDLVNNFNSVLTSFSNAGIKFVFTGHTHSNDIVQVFVNGNPIYDIGTGSIITPVSPYRILTIDDNFMKIETKKITSIDASALPAGMSFLDYSKSYYAEKLDLFLPMYLANPKTFGLPIELAKIFTPCLRNAYMAQSAGDEKLLPNENRTIEELNELYPNNPVVPLIYNFWTDLPPNDGSLHIKLK